MVDFPDVLLIELFLCSLVRLQKATPSSGTSTQSAPATPHQAASTAAGVGAGAGRTKDDIYIDDDTLEGSGAHGGVSTMEWKINRVTGNPLINSLVVSVMITNVQSDFINQR